MLNTAVHGLAKLSALSLKKRSAALPNRAPQVALGLSGPRLGQPPIAATHRDAAAPHLSAHSLGGNSLLWRLRAFVLGRPRPAPPILARFKMHARRPLRMPLLLRRLWPWSPCAHPGPWETQPQGMQNRTVFDALQSYLAALRAPATPRFFYCLSWNARMQRCLRAYVRSEHYLAADPASPYFRRQTARLGRLLHTTLKEFHRHYRGHPRFGQVDPIVRRTLFTLQQRGKDFGQRW